MVRVVNSLSSVKGQAAVLAGVGGKGSGWVAGCNAAVLLGGRGGRGSGLFFV